jgi:hypothetical protein
MGFILGATVLVTSCPVSALAAESHENPETAEPVFSGIALFGYYSVSLDSVLLKNPGDVEKKLSLMPFANVPVSINESTQTFSRSAIDIAYLVMDVAGNLSQIQELSHQSRFEEVTLKISPSAAFVGDLVNFEWKLVSGNNYLPGREINIRINGSSNLTVRTDKDGFFKDTLVIPYLYQPETDFQALYYPRDKDIGFYLASLSPMMTIKVLFYSAKLNLALESKAYHGDPPQGAGNQIATGCSRNSQIYQPGKIS